MKRDRVTEADRHATSARLGGFRAIVSDHPADRPWYLAEFTQNLANQPRSRTPVRLSRGFLRHPGFPARVHAVVSLRLAGGIGLLLILLLLDALGTVDLELCVACLDLLLAVSRFVTTAASTAEYMLV